MANPSTAEIIKAVLERYHNTLQNLAGAESTDNRRLSFLAYAETLHTFALMPSLHWSDTDEGALHLNPFPNPGRFAIINEAGFKAAIDCGPKGIGAGPSH